MCVCLINPPCIQPKAWGKPNVFPPISLAYVTAMLEKEHEVCIIDAPTEGWRNPEETIRFAYKLRQLGADSFIFSIAAPIYGTELYEQAKRGGFLIDGFCEDALAAADPLIETPEFTADELRELCTRANLVNPTFTRDKVLRAIRDPKKAIKLLLRKSK